MSHRQIEGEGLRTTYAFAPRFTSSARRDGPTSISLDFASSPIYRDDQEFRVTKLRFEHVVEFDWNHFRFHRFPSNPHDVEFSLIEIIDSQLIAEIKATGRYFGEELHHFRICFDDHGTYDIVCQTFTVSYGSSTDSEAYA